MFPDHPPLSLLALRVSQILPTVVLVHQAQRLPDLPNLLTSVEYKIA